MKTAVGSVVLHFVYFFQLFYEKVLKVLFNLLLKFGRYNDKIEKKNIPKCYSASFLEVSPADNFGKEYI